jgi:hypothetical protein
MEAQGYLADPDGVCDGIACMAIQAFLAADMAQFHLRLERLYTLEPGDHALEKDWDAQAFFQGIEINHNDKLHQPHLITAPASAFTESSRAFSSTAPSCLSNPTGGSQIKRSRAFTGIYNLQELKQLFSGIATACQQRGVGPIAFRLRNHRHVIMLGFNPKTQRWSHCGTPRLDDKTEYHSHDIALIVANGLLCHNWTADDYSDHDYMSFGLQSYCSTKNQAVFDRQLDIWLSSRDFLELNNAKRKARLKDHDGASWLFVCALCQDNATAKTLLSAGATANNSDGFNPLHAAVRYGDLALCKTLTSAGASLATLELDCNARERCEPKYKAVQDFLFGCEWSEFYNACKAGDVTQALCLYESTSFKKYLQKNHRPGLLQYLVYFGINTDYAALANKLSSNPADRRALLSQGLFIAATHDKYKLIRPLCKAGANYYCAYANGTCALSIALSKGYLHTAAPLLFISQRQKHTRPAQIAIHKAIQSVTDLDKKARLQQWFDAPLTKKKPKRALSYSKPKRGKESRMFVTAQAKPTQKPRLAKPKEEIAQTRPYTNAS